ncbi:hypothetical protein Y032_0495g2475 [Ancylostoma ceylanicum]|uniref:RING-type domain-containing protein n=1 Tax=Ancylostoma ceylanicum TaxID=53326 RepID=A0A016WUW7_9BILA|nr:hypothetical protein Y032_0495g2475 [Ancylostoma ceylanicum]
MHALLQNENFGLGGSYCFSGVDFNGIDASLFAGEQELIPIDGPRSACSDPLCRCRKCCPFDEKWDEALDGDLETVKTRFREEPSRTNSPSSRSDASPIAKSFFGFKSGFLNKKRQKPAEQRRSTKPPTAPPSSEETSRSELRGIRKGFLLREKGKEPPKEDITSSNLSERNVQPASKDGDILRSNITKSLVPDVTEEPRKYTTKVRKHAKLPNSLVAEPALEVERPPVHHPEPEVITPIKCSCCQSNIVPKKEVYYEVECVEDCKLFIHKHCLHSGMSSQNIKKKKELKVARCFTDGCSAVLHTIHEWNMDNSRELYIKCSEKQQSKEAVLSKKHKVKDKTCGTTEKIREKGSATDSHSPENEEISSNLEQQTAPMHSEPKTEASAEDDHVSDTSTRVTLAPDLNAVPLLRPKEEAVEKYTVASEPAKQHPKRNKQKKSRGVSISLDLPLFINTGRENGKQRGVKDQGSSPCSPSVHERNGSLPERRTFSEGNSWQGDTLVDGLEGDVFAMSIQETQEYFPSLTKEEHIVQPLVQIIEPSCRDLIANTTDLPQPISKLKETIETVVGRDIHSQKKLLAKVFESESLLRTFMRKLGIFTVSRMRGQIYYAKNSFARRLEQEALASTLADNITVSRQASHATRERYLNQQQVGSSFYNGVSCGESSHAFSQGDVCQQNKNRVPFSLARGQAWSPPGPSLKTRSVVLDERDCQICLERIARNRKVLQCPNMNCGEPYHLECIRKWLLCYAICPQCRSSWPDPISFPDMGRTNFIQNL